jgi:hypothetical protein
VAVVLGAVMLPEAGAGTKAIVNKLVVGPDGTTTKIVLPLRVIEEMGATVVEDYDEMAVVDLGPATAGALAETTQLKVALLPDHDRIMLRNFTFDARRGLPAGMASQPFPDSAANLFLVVFRSLSKSAWVARLEAVGRVVSYVPSNAYLVYAPRAELEALRARQPEIVSLLPFLPEFKVLDNERLLGADGFSRALVQVLRVPAGDTVIELVRANALPGTFGAFELHETTAVIAELPNDVVESLAAQPEVVLIEPAPQLEPAGERVALLVAGQLLSAQEAGRTVCKPNCAVDYYSWLSQAGLANASDIYLGLLDTGLDLGSTSNVHLDFRNTAAPPQSRVQYQGSPAGAPTASDCTGHGTLVAAVMAGSGGTSTGTQSSESTSCSGGTFWMGTGVAPAAKVASSKIYDESGNDWPHVPSRVANGLANFAGLGAQVANLSSNDHTSSATGYTSFAQLLDQRVRDASGIGLGIPISITVSASNEGNQAPKDPAPAKNVVTVGASEGYNRYYDSGSCFGFGSANNAFDVWTSSCDGSRSDTADLGGGASLDKRVKPDLVAPGTRVMGARSQAWSSGCWFVGLCSPNPLAGTGNAAIGWYGGTSFAAPAVAGAAGLVGKWYATTHSSGWPSPAMTKAMLINAARDIAGGLYGNVSVDHVPSWYQGWGKVDLTRAFPASANYYDLGQTWAFATSGSNAWSRAFTVRDGSKAVYVTLVWTDTAGFGGNGYALKNDLDVYVDAPLANAHFVGNSFDNSTGYSIRYVGGQQLQFDSRTTLRRSSLRPAPMVLWAFSLQCFRDQLSRARKTSRCL